MIQSMTYPHFSLRRIVLVAAWMGAWMLTNVPEIFAQEPPPQIELDYRHLAAGESALRADFEFDTRMFRGLVRPPSVELPAEEKARLIRSVEGQRISLYLYNENIRLPQQCDLIRLTIRSKTSEARMDIFIRVDFDMRYGETLALGALRFQPGTYFLDFRASKKRFTVQGGRESEPPIAVERWSKHKVSERKLNRILKKTTCANGEQPELP
ncbi:MAG: hypothetical protein AAF570_14900, partial [Bacteroidota bacterium]